MGAAAEKGFLLDVTQLKNVSLAFGGERAEVGEK